MIIQMIQLVIMTHAKIMAGLSLAVEWEQWYPNLCF